jgi:CheY-like chemotaxis protein
MNDPRQLKILVADDTDTDRFILETIVKKEGHNVVSAANGQQAVDLFLAESPDMVLMDALMPVMDGFEAARLIKQHAGDKFIPILFLTSLSDAESLVKFFIKALQPRCFASKN